MRSKPLETVLLDASTALVQRSEELRLFSNTLCHLVCPHLGPELSQAADITLKAARAIVAHIETNGEVCMYEADKASEAPKPEAANPKPDTVGTTAFTYRDASLGALDPAEILQSVVRLLQMGADLTMTTDHFAGLVGKFPGLDEMHVAYGQAADAVMSLARHVAAFGELEIRVVSAETLDDVVRH